MILEICLDRCVEFGYMVVGLEYGEECYCGDLENMNIVGFEFVDELDCGVLCFGDFLVICGGGLRFFIYFWEGDLFYFWIFFVEGLVVVGFYDFFIGGVVILFIMF